ncbi:MAG: ROK family protein [Candidatus Kapabacteria bacterium]|nr:ROK family protein [Candidatus Kapabacteria bacterium]
MIGAIDIGGTNIKYGVVSQGGVIEWEQSIPTHALDGLDAVIKRLRGVVTQITERSPNVQAIGIGVPGVVDPTTKHVQAPPNLPGWHNVDLLAALSPLPFALAIENDANAAALGEATMGAGMEHPNFLYVTLGTGIGGGVILDGQPYRGPHGDAGEIGHIILDAWAREGALDPRPFRTGVMEEYAGLQGILRMAREQGEDAENIRRIQNDAVFKEAGRVIGIGLCSALAVLGLRVVIIGGGVSQAPFIIESIKSTMKHRAIPTIADALLVLPARFGSHAGLIGAAAVGRAVVAA